MKCRLKWCRSETYKAQIDEQSCCDKRACIAPNKCVIRCALASKLGRWFHKVGNQCGKIGICCISIPVTKFSNVNERSRNADETKYRILGSAQRHDVSTHSKDLAAKRIGVKKNVPLSTVAEELESNDVAVPLVRGMTTREPIY